MRIKSILACAAIAPFLIAAANPLRLQPSSPWDVDYAANSCRLIRVFGTDKTETKLAFESTAPGTMDMLVFGKPLETYQERVAAKFLPVGSDTFDGRLAQTVTKEVPAILWSNVPLMNADELARVEREKDQRKANPGVRPAAVPLAEQARRRTARHQFADAITAIEIDARRNRPVILETGSLGDAIAAFDKCSHDSLKDWGVDPDVDDKIVRPVWAENPTRWLFESDYPRDLLMRGQESAVSVRLLIDATGKVTNCTSLSHYNEAEFNRITCALITQRARFQPAELADGTKVPSYYTQRVIFQIGR